MSINRTATAYTIAALLFYSATALAWEDHNEIKVMSQNQYLGADLAPLLAADQDQFNEVLVGILKKVADSRFRDRAQRQAAQIAKERPHVVALQEAWRLDCQDLRDPPVQGHGCDDPEIKAAFVDYLQVTLLALKAQRQQYKAVAIVKNLDVSLINIQSYPAGIPFVINGFPAELNTIDRDAILVRYDIPAQRVDLTKVCPTRISLDGCNYQAIVKAPIFGGPPDGLPIERGFVAADVKVGEKNYRVVNTHLELREPDPTQPLSRIYQAAQATELIQTLQLTTPMDKSLLVLGDMNSSPEDKVIPGDSTLSAPYNSDIIPPYLQFVDAGYTDGWTLRRRITPGYTCCQAEDLLNKRSELFERIDYIFSKQEVWGDVGLVGIRQSDKTFPPAARLWPSDHAGLVGELHFWE